MAKNEQNTAYIPDETDKKIINILLKNSKTTNRDIAARLQIALGTVNKRIKRLEKEEIIKNYRATVDYEKLGYIIDVIISLKIKEGKFSEVGNRLIHNPHVFTLYDITGEIDAEIVARFSTKRQLDNFIKDLQQQEYIESTSTRLLLDIVEEKEVK